MAQKHAKHYWTALMVSASIAEAAHAPLVGWKYQAGDVTMAGRPAAVDSRHAAGSKHLPGWLTIASYFSKSYPVMKPANPAEKQNPVHLQQPPPPLLTADPALADANPVDVQTPAVAPSPDGGADSVADADSLPGSLGATGALAAGEITPISNFSETAANDASGLDGLGPANPAATQFTAASVLSSPASTTAVPEPAMTALVGVAAALLLGRRRRHTPSQVTYESYPKLWV